MVWGVVTHLPSFLLCLMPVIRPQFIFHLQNSERTLCLKPAGVMRQRSGTRILLGVGGYLFPKCILQDFEEDSVPAGEKLSGGLFLKWASKTLLKVLDFLAILPFGKKKKVGEWRTSRLASVVREEKKVLG